MGDEKVDVAVLKAILSEFRSRLQELYHSQTDFLKEWPNHVSKVATLEGKIEALDKKLVEYIDAQRFSWTTVLSVVSSILAAVLLWWDVFKTH